MPGQLDQALIQAGWDAWWKGGGGMGMERGGGCQRGFQFLTAALFPATTLPVPLPHRFRESMAGRLQGLLPCLITLPHTVFMYGDWD